MDFVHVAHLNETLPPRFRHYEAPSKYLQLQLSTHTTYHKSGPSPSPGVHSPQSQSRPMATPTAHARLQRLPTLPTCRKKQFCSLLLGATIPNTRPFPFLLPTRNPQPSAKHLLPVQTTTRNTPTAIFLGRDPAQTGVATFQINTNRLSLQIQKSISPVRTAPLRLDLKPVRRAIPSQSSLTLVAYHTDSHFQRSQRSQSCCTLSCTHKPSFPPC